jgi:RecB family exonuclease
VGTADAVVVRGGELVVIDLKTGHNKVDAKNNHQLVIYAMAALKAYNEGTLTKSVPPVETVPVDEFNDDDDLV